MKAHSISLIAVLEEIQPVVGCEVGVHRGKNAYELLKYFPTLQLHLVDPYDRSITTTLREDQDQLHASEREARKRIEPYEHRAFWHRLPSAEAVKVVPLQLDFVFIDADHTEKCVHEDITLWYPLVRKGGIIAGHDYGGRGDRTGRFGVKKAVDAFFKSNTKQEVHTEPGLVWWVNAHAA